MPEIEVTFFNRAGQRLAGVLNLPAQEAEPHPAVLLCQGLSGVKHLVLPRVAASLAAAGFASLRFDYAGYGDSEGERGWVDPPARVHDALYAFAWLSQQPGIDQAHIGVHGHSYGGPVAIHLAAREPAVRAVVAVSGPGDGRTMLESLRTSWDWIAFKDRVAKERAHVAATGQPTLVGINEIFPFSPKFFLAYETLKASGGGTSAMNSDYARAAFKLASVDAILDFHPEDAARRLGNCPLLLVHGEADDVAPVETIEPIYVNAPGPKEWVIVPGADHNDLDAGPGLAQAIELAAAWFARHLKT
jgi:pimeloyl-ACP methyl ester carboxylesterase